MVIVDITAGSPLEKSSKDHCAGDSRKPRPTSHAQTNTRPTTHAQASHGTKDLVGKSGPAKAKGCDSTLLHQVEEVCYMHTCYGAK